MFGVESISPRQDQPDRFFVGEESALWDWIIAENYFPVAAQPDASAVEAPKGYRFHYGSMFPQVELEEVDEVSRYISAPKRTAGAAKVHSLFEMLEEVSQDEFRAKGISPNRIVAVTAPEVIAN
jgi:hypothetical protein